MYNPSEMKPVTISAFKTARLPKMYDNIKVAMGTEETIYDAVYITGVVNGNRKVKFLKSSLEFSND